MMGPRVADNITCFEESLAVTMKRLIKTGAMFDTLAWTRKVSRIFSVTLMILYLFYPYPISLPSSPGDL